MISATRSVEATHMEGGSEARGSSQTALRRETVRATRPSGFEPRLI